LTGIPPPETFALDILVLRLRHWHRRCLIQSPSSLDRCSLIVVFDTNIWIGDLALQTSAASAVRFYLRKVQARVALLEVIRLEVERHTRRILRDATEDIRRGHRNLLAVFGRLPEVVLPTESAIEAKVTEMFSLANLDVFDVPFSADSARDSFLRTIDKVPPSDKDQQFKDGVIWADCVKLLAIDDVILVTKDKAFYRERAYASGLAPNLKDEASKAAHRLTLLPGLTELLDDIRSPVRIDDDRLTDFCRVTQGEPISTLLGAAGFELGGRRALSQKLFATEDPRRLFVEFTIVFDSTSPTGAGAVLTVTGSCTYDPESGELTNYRAGDEELVFLDSDGNEVRRANRYMHAGEIVLGHREVRHSVLHEL